MISLCNFEDEWGGEFDKRVRLVVNIIPGIKLRCSDKFLLAVRFSPENYGSSEHYPLAESFNLMDILVEEGVDLLRASLWNVRRGACIGRLPSAMAEFCSGLASFSRQADATKCE